MEQPTALFLSVPLFCFLYLLAYYCLLSRWTISKARFEAASCCMSLLHALVTATAAGHQLLCNPWVLNAANTAAQNTIMEFSIAYFAVDLLHYLFFAPDDYKFILHHVATSLYIASCRFYARHGALSVMALMGLGEATTPLQSVWSIARMARGGSPFARRVYEATSLPFTIIFTFTRGLLGPILTWKLCQFYLFGRGRSGGNVPFWIGASWMALAVLGLAGSIMWTKSLWAGLRKFRAQQKR